MMKWILPLLLVLVACVKEDTTPEGALKTFATSRIGHVVDRDFILSKVTGNLKASLENVSQEEFEKFADMRNIKQDSFKILTKSCIEEEKKCNITYSLAYKTEENNKSVFSSEVKKVAVLIQQEDGTWLISDVTNIKTFHESLDPLSP